MKKLSFIAALAAIATTAFLFTGCATEGPAPRTHAKHIHIGVDTNNVPVVDITEYDNPKDLVVSYDPETKTYMLKSSNNPNVIDSSAAANAAYLNAMSALINSAITTGINASAKSLAKP